MTEMIYLRCDGCGAEVTDEFVKQPKNWAHVAITVNHQRFHYCSKCWKKMKPTKGERT